MSESPERVESVSEQEPTQPERTPSPEGIPSPGVEHTGSLEQLEPASTPPQSPDDPNEEVRTVPSRPTHLFPSKSDPASSPVLDTDADLSLNEGETPPHDSTADVITGTPTPVLTPTSRPEEKARQAEERGSLPRFGDVGAPSLFAEQITSGVTFEMHYLGTTKLKSPNNPSKSQHLQMCREVLSRIKMPQGEMQPLTPISVFISTRTLQLLDPATGNAMLQHPLPSISYISDVGNNLVIMVKGDAAEQNGRNGSENGEEREEAATPDSPTTTQLALVCHLLESPNAHSVAVTMGHAFNVAYRQFLRSSGINEDQLAVAEYSTVLSAQKMTTEHLESLTDAENQRRVMLEKKAGEPLGLMLIESGWGSMLPTCVVGHMAKSGAAALSNKINIGDHVIRLCGQSLVGIPLDKSIELARSTRSLVKVSMELASCNPVVEVNIIRPDVKFPLGFTVQDGDIVSLSRGSISDRSGVRVGHRIIEINGQSTINMKHEHIVTMLKTSIGELLLKTMPIHLYKLTLGLDQPIYV